MSLQGGINNDRERERERCHNHSVYECVHIFHYKLLLNLGSTLLFDNYTMTFFVPPLQDCHLKPLRLLRSNKKKSRKER